MFDIFVFISISLLIAQLSLLFNFVFELKIYTILIYTQYIFIVIFIDILFVYFETFLLISNNISFNLLLLEKFALVILFSKLERVIVDDKLELNIHYI